jgi:hypothetical protein
MAVNAAVPVHPLSPLSKLCCAPVSLNNEHLWIARIAALIAKKTSGPSDDAVKGAGIALWLWLRSTAATATDSSFKSKMASFFALGLASVVHNVALALRCGAHVANHESRGTLT